MIKGQLTNLFHQLISLPASQALDFVQIHFVSLRLSCLVFFSSLNGSPTMTVPSSLLLASHLSYPFFFHILFFLSVCLLLAPHPPPLHSPQHHSHPLCYVCCLAALSFTCQLGSGLWSSNMTNCPLIHLHSRTHRSAHTCSAF